MKLPYGASNFEKVRTEGYYYIDKTGHILNLYG
ncbi:MAG: AAA family ATPase [Desulfobacteraceae bacterium]|nr:AAA family ATPase [Desulfobacteraceae bacterium]